MVEIEINDMQFYAHHGCYDLEQKVGTYFTVSMRLKYDAAEAIETDDVTKAVNYLSVYETIKKERPDIPCVLITDRGLTEFNGIPTNTCIGIGPFWSKDIDVYTKHLKLL